MLGGVKAAGGADWSVLIMDAVTTKVMSKAARISEILDFGVSRALPLAADRGIWLSAGADQAHCSSWQPAASVQLWLA